MTSDIEEFRKAIRDGDCKSLKRVLQCAGFARENMLVQTCLNGNKDHIEELIAVVKECCFQDLSSEQWTALLEKAQQSAAKGLSYLEYSKTEKEKWQLFETILLRNLKQ